MFSNPSSSSVRTRFVSVGNLPADDRVAQHAHLVDGVADVGEFHLDGRYVTTRYQIRDIAQIASIVLCGHGSIVAIVVGVRGRRGHAHNLHGRIRQAKGGHALHATATGHECIVQKCGFQLIAARRGIPEAQACRDPPEVFGPRATVKISRPHVSRLDFGDELLPALVLRFQQHLHPPMLQFAFIFAGTRSSRSIFGKPLCSEREEARYSASSWSAAILGRRSVCHRDKASLTSFVVANVFASSTALRIEMLAPRA